MSTATITIPFAATQRTSALPSRPAVTKAPTLSKATAHALRRSLTVFAGDTLEVLHGIAAYGFVLMLMYWMGAFLYAVL